MNDSPSTPVVKRATDIEYEAVGAADGMSKGVLLDESDGAPNFALRRFTLEPGASVPKHTNEVEHEQYVLAGSYTVGVREMSKPSPADGEAVDDDEEFTVNAGDSLLIPAGAVHWYRNDSELEGAFLCVVPNGDDSIDLLDE